MMDNPGKRRKARIRSVTVTAIDPAKYPQFCKDADNPYSSQSDEERMGELADICGRILCQAGLETKSPVETTDAA
jgi:hypothetical protein